MKKLIIIPVITIILFGCHTQKTVKLGNGEYVSRLKFRKILNKAHKET